MPNSVPALSVVLTYLRLIRGWSRKELARAAQVSVQSIQALEAPRRSRPDTVQLRFSRLIELCSLMGFSSEEVDLAVLLHGIVSAAGPHWPLPLDSPLSPSAADVRLASRLAARMGLAEAHRRRAELLNAALARHIHCARQAAVQSWGSLRRQPPLEQARSVEQRADLASWAVIECITADAERAAANDPAESLRLAQLALRRAAIAQPTQAWAERCSAYAGAYVANALRVASDFSAADVEWARVWQLWFASEGLQAPPLEVWRLYDLEASLRRDQRRFSEAFSCLDRAAAAAPLGARGRILLKRQITLEHFGDIESAVAILDQAAAIFDVSPDPELAWHMMFNSVGMLCHAGRYSEAESRLPALLESTLAIRGPLDRARVTWLAGRVAAGLGRRDEARAAFEKVQQTFSSNRISFDTALVSIELCMIYLQDGRTAAAAILAEDVLAMFTAQRVHREPIAALKLFYEAAQQGAATVEQAQRIHQLLERVRSSSSRGARSLSNTPVESAR